MLEDKCFFTGSDTKTMKINARKHAEQYFGELDIEQESLVNEFYICQQVHYDIFNRIDALPPVIANQIKGNYPSLVGANGFTYQLLNPLKCFPEQIDSIMISDMNGNQKMYHCSIMSGEGIGENAIFVSWWCASEEKNDILSKCSEIVESNILNKEKLRKMKELLRGVKWHMMDLPCVVQLYRDFSSIEGGDVTAIFLRARKPAAYQYALSVQCTACMMGDLNEIVIQDIKNIFQFTSISDFPNVDECTFTAKIKHSY